MYAATTSRANAKSSLPTSRAWLAAPVSSAALTAITPWLAALASAYRHGVRSITVLTARAVNTTARAGAAPRQVATRTNGAEVLKYQPRRAWVRGRSSIGSSSLAIAKPHSATSREVGPQSAASDERVATTPAPDAPRTLSSSAK